MNLAGFHITTDCGIHRMEGESSGGLIKKGHHIPQVADSVKPKIGQAFISVDDAYTFYNAYAKEAGFSTRNDSSKRRKGTNELYWKQFVCNKEGNSALNSVEKNRSILRVGCKARLTVYKRQSSTNWVVNTFVEEHNHVLATPKRVHLLRSHRTVSVPKKALSKQLADVSIPTSQQLRMMEIQADGVENIEYPERDLRKFERDVREEMKGHDAETLYEFFRSEKEKNPLFYFEFDKDEKDRMIRCFWADPMSRRSYIYFGDVVVFDTTYKTNKYGMVFALLMGINHHGQTIIFGCGLLSDERTESFVWLFKQWLNAMVNGPPQVIITNQDPTMTIAIAEVLPQTVHCFCISHIMNKFSEKLEAMKHQDYYHYFQRSVYDSDTPEEFEASWMYALEKSSLQDHDWLCRIFEIRDKWVPAYVNHIFCAAMLRNQRVGSSHCFFKMYVSKNNSLIDFITRFNRALGHQRHDELVFDHADITEQPVLQARHPMEKQMVGVYTKKIFLTFQEELLESNAYVVKTVSETEDECVYMIESVEQGTSKVRRVVYDIPLDFARCTCRFFDFEGIPCRHILAFFRVKQVLYLPDSYILRRWTRSAKIGRNLCDCGFDLNNETNSSLMVRHAKLSQLCSVVVDDASLLEEGTDILRNAVELAHEKIKELNKSKGLYEVSAAKEIFSERMI